MYRNINYFKRPNMGNQSGKGTVANSDRGVKHDNRSNQTVNRLSTFFDVSNYLQIAI